MDQNGKFKNVSAFFNFDGIPYQYVGLKRRDGVNTGKKSTNIFVIVKNELVKFYPN